MVLTNCVDLNSLNCRLNILVTVFEIFNSTSIPVTLNSVQSELKLPEELTNCSITNKVLVTLIDSLVSTN